MCGIAGFITDEHINREVVLGEMLQSIRHRGPDGDGMVHEDAVSLGHVRLAIIDPEHGQQPMVSGDGRYTLTFNGEIYNYFELRQHLMTKGYRFHTHCDTEVLLNLLIEYDIEAFSRLNGMFAFGFYDKKRKRLLLARDHFGIKPLYYWSSGDAFVFASEIKALLKYPGVPRQTDRESLEDYVTFQMVLHDRTLFEDLRKIEPAHYMIVESGRLVQNRAYWDLDYTIDTDHSVQKFADELLVTLESASTLQIRSDVPVGAYLSGGLDSSIVAALAARNYHGDFKTFTGGFREGDAYDETAYARLMSRAINSKHFEIFPSAQDFVKSFETIMYHMDEPCGGPGVFPQYMVSRLASEHVKVILGGQGGDELFGGYARYAVAYLEQCLKGAIFGTQEEGQHVVTLNSIVPHMSSLKQYVPLIQRQFSGGLFGDMDERYFHLVDRSVGARNLYSTDMLRMISPERVFEKFRRVFHKADTRSYLNKMTYFDLKTLLPALLHIEDRMGMAVSIESRVPLLDYRIAELSARIPPTMKFAGGKLKAVLLESVKNILPSEIINRNDKMGFPTPVNIWFRGPLKDYVMDMFGSRSSGGSALFDHNAIRTHIEEDGAFNRGIWGAVCLEMWFRTFIDRA